MARDFWRSSGAHLLERTGEGWLAVTPDFIRAYLTRPEVHPVETSCAEEVRLFESLMADPLRKVAQASLAKLQDADAADNYRVILAFRDELVSARTIEQAYVRIMQEGHNTSPPVFIDQLVHVILRNALRDAADPFRLRAAELLFREQVLSTDGGRVLLADEEIVESHARVAKESGLAQLLADSDTPLRRVELDVLTLDNKDIYWGRSERFDTVVDFRFGEPATDALARVMETWLRHLTGRVARIEPVARITEADWRWHIGLDREATTILNALYRGEAPAEAQDRLVGLFRMRLAEEADIIERVRGRPIYLGLAMSANKRVRMKPQNLLTNLPITGDGRHPS
jgi:hypothetical protein